MSKQSSPRFRMRSNTLITMNQPLLIMRDSSAIKQNQNNDMLKINEEEDDININNNININIDPQINQNNIQYQQQKNDQADQVKRKMSSQISANKQLVNTLALMTTRQPNTRKTQKKSVQLKWTLKSLQKNQMDARQNLEVYLQQQDIKTSEFKRVLLEGGGGTTIINQQNKNEIVQKSKTERSQSCFENNSSYKQDEVIVPQPYINTINLHNGYLNNNTTIKNEVINGDEQNLQQQQQQQLSLKSKIGMVRYQLQLQLQKEQMLENQEKIQQRMKEQKKQQRRMHLMQRVGHIFQQVPVPTSLKLKQATSAIAASSSKDMNMTTMNGGTSLVNKDTQIIQSVGQAKDKLAFTLDFSKLKKKNSTFPKFIDLRANKINLKQHQKSLTQRTEALLKMSIAQNENKEKAMTNREQDLMDEEFDLSNYDRLLYIPKSHKADDDYDLHIQHKNNEKKTLFKQHNIDINENKRNTNDTHLNENEVQSPVKNYIKKMEHQMKIKRQARLEHEIYLRTEPDERHIQDQEELNRLQEISKARRKSFDSKQIYSYKGGVLPDQLTLLIETIDISKDKGFFFKVQNQQLMQKHKDVISYFSSLVPAEVDQIKKQTFATNMLFDNLKKDLQNKKRDFKKSVVSDRRQTMVLRNWLQQSLQLIFSNECDTAKDKMDLTDEVFNLCINELMRQISVQCVERGEFLVSMWSNYFKLTRKYNEHEAEIQKVLQNDYVQMELLFKQKQKEFIDQCMVKIAEKEMLQHVADKNYYAVRGDLKFQKQVNVQQQDHIKHLDKAVEVLHGENDKLKAENHRLEKEQLVYRDQIQKQEIRAFKQAQHTIECEQRILLLQTQLKEANAVIQQEITMREDRQYDLHLNSAQPFNNNFIAGQQLQYLQLQVQQSVENMSNIVDDNIGKEKTNENESDSSSSSSSLSQSKKSNKINIEPPTEQFQQSLLKPSVQKTDNFNKNVELVERLKRMRNQEPEFDEEGNKISVFDRLKEDPLVELHRIDSSKVMAYGILPQTANQVQFQCQTQYEVNMLLQGRGIGADGKAIISPLAKISTINAKQSSKYQVTTVKKNMGVTTHLNSNASDQNNNVLSEQLFICKETQLDSKTYHADFFRTHFSHSVQTDLSLLSPEYDQMLKQKEMRFQIMEHRIREQLILLNLETPSDEILEQIMAIFRLAKNNEYFNENEDIENDQDMSDTQSVNTITSNKSNSSTSQGRRKSNLLMFQSLNEKTSKKTLKNRKSVLKVANSRRFSQAQPQLQQLTQSLLQQPSQLRRMATQQVQQNQPVPEDITEVSDEEAEGAEGSENEKEDENEIDKKQENELKGSQQERSPDSKQSNTSQTQQNEQKNAGLILFQSQKSNELSGNLERPNIKRQNTEPVTTAPQTNDSTNTTAINNDALSLSPSNNPLPSSRRNSFAKKNEDQSDIDGSQQMSATTMKLSKKERKKQEKIKQKQKQLEEEKEIMKQHFINKNNIFKGNLERAVYQMIKQLTIMECKHVHQKHTIFSLSKCILVMSDFIENTLLKQLHEFYIYFNPKVFSNLVLRYENDILGEMIKNDDLMGVLRMVSFANVLEADIQNQKFNQNSQINNDTLVDQQLNNMNNIISKPWSQKITLQNQLQPIKDSQTKDGQTLKQGSMWKLKQRIQEEVSRQKRQSMLIKRTDTRKPSLAQIDAEQVQQKEVISFEIELLANQQCYEGNEVSMYGDLINTKLKEGGRMDTFTGMFPQKMVLKYITDITEKMCYEQRTNKVARGVLFSSFVFFYFYNRFPELEVAQQKYAVFVVSLLHYKKILRVNIFARCLKMLDDDMNYADLETKLYIDVLNYLVHDTAFLGETLDFVDTDERRMVPLLRVKEYMRTSPLFTQNQLNSEEMQTFNTHVLQSKEIDHEHKKNLKEGNIEVDGFLVQLIALYRSLMARTRKHVICAFQAVDLDFNQVVDINEFMLLLRYIESDKFKTLGQDKIVSIFKDNAIKVQEGYRVLGLDRFIQLCLTMHICSDEAQYKFMGIITDQDEYNRVKEEEEQLKQEQLEVEQMLLELQQLQNNNKPVDAKTAIQQQQKDKNIKNIKEIKETIESKRGNIQKLKEGQNQKLIGDCMEAFLASGSDFLDKQVLALYLQMDEEWNSVVDTLEDQFLILRPYMHLAQHNKLRSIMLELNQKIKRIDSKIQRMTLKDLNKCALLVNADSVKPIIMSVKILRTEVQRRIDYCLIHHHETVEYTEREQWQLNLLQNTIKNKESSIESKSLV